MRYTCFVILLSIGLLASAQKVDTSNTFVVKKNTGLTFVQQLAGIPWGYIVVSCNVTCSTKGEVFKTYLTMDNIPVADAFFNRLLPNDIIYIDNVTVRKDGVQTKWPDKIGAIRYEDRLGSLNLLRTMLIDTAKIK